MGGSCQLELVSCQLSVYTLHCFCPALGVLRVLCGSRILVRGLRSVVARDVGVQPIFQILRRAEVDQSEQLADLFPIMSDFVQVVHRLPLGVITPLQIAGRA